MTINPKEVDKHLGNLITSVLEIYKPLRTINKAREHIFKEEHNELNSGYILREIEYIQSIIKNIETDITNIQNELVSYRDKHIYAPGFKNKDGSPI